MSSEAQRKANAAKQARYRAKKAAEKAQQPNTATMGNVSGEVPEAGPVTSPDDAPLNITVKASDATPKPKLTLRERLLGKKQATPTPVKRAVGRAKKTDKPNLVVTVLPTLLASLIAAYCKDRIPEEYQPCAPDQQEVQGIIGPLLDLIGRRIDVAAEVSQDAIDITNSIICGMAYGVRAYITYINIRKAKEAGYTYGQKQQQTGYRDEYIARVERDYEDYNNSVTADGEPSLAGGLKAYQGANNGTSGNPDRVDVIRPASEQHGLASNGAGSPSDDKQLRDREASLVANMFARDKQGRMQLGLLPR